MTVKIRQYRKTDMYECDISFRWPDGTPFRERRRSPVSGKVASMRWGKAREVELLHAGKAALEPPVMEKEVPTLTEFKPRFIEGYCNANRQKPSGISTKESAFKTHLIPLFGSKRLDQIKNEDVQFLKSKLATKKSKTLNNVLSTLNVLLKTAVEWGVILEMPCRIRLVKASSEGQGWYELVDYQRLVEAASKIDPRIHVMVLLAGDAGLRRGEIIALRWTDVDLGRRLIYVRRSIWASHESETKGFRDRIVPMTDALHTALNAHRHLRGPRILYTDDNGELTNKIVRRWLEKAERRAGLEVTGGIHRLRHTFCSMLATEGAPTKAIQELAGHQNLSTTMKYMHLSPATRDGAVRLLDAARVRLGEGLEKPVKVTTTA